jgi:hypothetical protein
MRKSRPKLHDVTHEIDDNVDITEEIAKALFDAGSKYDIDTDEVKNTLTSSRFKKIFEIFKKKNIK